MQGAVIFDRTASGDIRTQLNEINREYGIGVQLDGTPGVRIAAIGGITAAVATAGHFEPVQLKGVDLLTGEPNPVVQPGNYAAMVAENYRGPYVISMNGVVVLGEHKLQIAEAVEGGVRVEARGLLQAASIDGRVNVATATGRELPKVDEETLLEWLFFETQEGIATFPVGYEGAVVTYIRCSESIIVTRQGL